MGTWYGKREREREREKKKKREREREREKNKRVNVIPRFPSSLSFLSSSPLPPPFPFPCWHQDTRGRLPRASGKLLSLPDTLLRPLYTLSFPPISFPLQSQCSLTIWHFTMASQTLFFFFFFNFFRVVRVRIPSMKERIHTFSRPSSVDSCLCLCVKCVCGIYMCFYLKFLM